MNVCNIRNVLLINQDKKEMQLLEKSIGAYCPSALFVRIDDALKGMNILVNERFDAVFADYELTVRGINFLREIDRKKIFIPTVVIIEEGHELNAAEAVKEGAFDYIIRRQGTMELLPSVLERIQSIFPLKGEQGEEMEEQSLLFKRIYRSQKWWQNIIDAITDYLFVIDKNYKILRTNKAFAGLFGKEPADIIMKPYYELFDRTEPHEWCTLPKSRDSSSSYSVERPLNDTVYLISCFPIYYDEHDAAVYILKDITETRRLKDQIYHLDKLSSLGTLTSGVAHEINNPLTGIIGYTEMLLMSEQGETTKKYLRNVYDSAIRCKRIVENMLTFSRQNPAQKSPEDINDIIDKTVELHEYWLRSTNIEIIRDYGEVPYVAVDRQQMQQVILNLLINAEHAIADTKRKGRIELKTTLDSQSGSTVITITDNGKGIPQDILPKIFDPFFTTKPVNKGTGLGLSIAHGIIAEQGGTIEVKSAPGEGTSFIITLPNTKLS